jgi:hypothetical protein
MMMPNLLSQFVPRVSSIAETVFMRSCIVGFGDETLGGETLNAETGNGVEIRAARVDDILPGGCAGGTTGTGGGVGAAAGFVAGGGATGTDGFTSAGVFPAAGKTVSGSAGVGGVGGFCGGVLAGVTRVGAGNFATGSCGFSGCSSVLFSAVEIATGGGTLTGGGNSTRAGGAGVSLTGGATGAIGRSIGFSAIDGTGWQAATICFFTSATSR